MGDWSYLSSLLDKVQSHSTLVGKVWMSVLFLFRIFVLGAAADKVWGDEVSEFYCDSLEPGCKHSCYNWMFPISFVHYWVLQITFVSTPTLFYLGHAVHILHREKRVIEESSKGTSEKNSKYADDRGKLRVKGVLFCSYMTQLVFKILLEVGFSVGQFYIFGPVFIVPYFHCTMSPPCARYSGAQCYISRPTEKTIFIIFMLVVSGISVFLNILEMIYLLCDRKRYTRGKFGAPQHELILQPILSNSPLQHHPSYRISQHQQSNIPLQHHPSNSISQHQQSNIPLQHHPSNSISQHQQSNIPLQHHPSNGISQHQQSNIPLQHHPSNGISQHQQSNIPLQNHQFNRTLHHRPSSSPSLHRPSHSTPQHYQSNGSLQHCPSYKSSHNSTTLMH